MNNPHGIDRPDYIQIVEDLVITNLNDKRDFLTHYITVTSSEGHLIEFTLYIIAPAINYEYRVLNIEVIDTAFVKIRYFTMATEQSQQFDVDVSQGLTAYAKKINDIFNFSLFKGALNSLINQIELRKEYRTSPIREKIISGQARVAILLDNTRINVGWIRIEGEYVVYYTGKGLREIWKPNMDAQEQTNAEILKTKSEEYLIKEGYIAQKRLSEFKDVL